MWWTRVNMEAVKALKKKNGTLLPISGGFVSFSWSGGSNVSRGLWLFIRKGADLLTNRNRRLVKAIIRSICVNDVLTCGAARVAPAPSSQPEKNENSGTSPTGGT